MSRVNLITCVVVCGVAVLVVASRRAQSGQSDGIVRLQASTPGIQQVGNLNISGKARASAFLGNGEGVTNVNAAQLGGLPASAFLQSIPIPLILSGTVASQLLESDNASTSLGATSIRGRSTGATGMTYGVVGESFSTDGVGVSGTAGSLSGATYGGQFVVLSTDGVGVSGLAGSSSGATYGGYFQTNSSAGRGVYGLANSATGVSYGGYFDSNSAIGSGVYATSAGLYGIEAFSTLTSGTAYGGYFQTLSTTGRGVAGVVAPTTGLSYAGYFINNSVNGKGIYTVSAGPYGIEASSTLTIGAAYGGYFQSASQTGRGAVGYASAATGTNIGIYGQSDSSSGRGVFGLGNAVGASDTPYGVRGQASTSTLGYAVYALGDMGASGVKPFRIDHPDDPANKYLLHYSSESPFPQNFYNGNVTTDGKGYAWVELPDYFEEINTNFKYQLTVIGKSFAQAIVSEEIQGTRFQIRTSEPNIKVSWEVKADRNDLRVRFNRPTDVREKTGPEKGKYQHPEYYGLPPSMGMDYEAKQAKATKSSP